MLMLPCANKRWNLASETVIMHGVLIQLPHWWIYATFRAMLNWPLSSSQLLPASCMLCDSVCLVVVNWCGSCDCHAGWTGDYCETNIDECALSFNNSEPLCLHGGVCNDTLGSYTCYCDNTGYTGMSSCCWLYWLLSCKLVSLSDVGFHDITLIQAHQPLHYCLSWPTSTTCTSHVDKHRVKLSEVITGTDASSTTTPLFTLSAFLQCKSCHRCHYLL